MKFLSVCSGIEAASVAWKNWEPVAFSEIEPFPCAVLKHHYPSVPNWGDMTKFKEWPDAAVDVLVGGTPCQSFSVAGLRQGLDDPRGNLMLTYLAIAAKYRPAWVVWENVPGVLSSNGGRDFASLLRGLGELGYGWAYRVLDAQYFGVAQRRRRVFVVGHLGDWHRAAAVLFERHSLSGNPAPSRKAREGVAGGAETRFVYGGASRDCADTVTSKWSKGSGGPAGNECGLFVAQPTPYDLFQVTAPVNRQAREPGDPCHTLARDNAAHAAVVQAVAIQGNLIGRDSGGPQGVGASEDGVMYTLTKADVHGVAQPIAWDEELNARNDLAGAMLRGGDGGRHDGVMTNSMQVRRLTPRECERLQGFPSIREAITMTVCLDRQNGCVSVALSCLRWQRGASPADAKRFPPFASVAESRLSIHQAGQEPLAAASVHTSSVDQLLEIRSHGRLIWSANSAERSSKCHPSIQAENIAAELAQAARELALAIRTGKAESLQRIRLSFPVSNGEKNALMCGAESAASAKDAGSIARPERFTTSILGNLVPTSGSQLETSLCSALAAISGCIQSETLPESFSLLLDLETPYTLIPWRGKEAPDGPRYKALGNSMAVPVMAWIGQRIAQVAAISAEEAAA